MQNSAASSAGRERRHAQGVGRDAPRPPSTGRAAPSRRVVLRASRSRALLDRLSASLSDRAVGVLNVLAFVSLAAALLVLLLA